MSFLDKKKKILFIHIPKTGGTSMASVFGEKASHENIRFYYEKEELNDYFKFAFVRNPYNRYASILDNLGTSAEKTQFSFIQIEGKIVMDFVGKFENIEEDWERVCKIIGNYKLPHLNKGEHKPLTEKQREHVRAFYDQDFKFFNYKKL